VHRLKMREVGRAERTAYCYGGETCDQVEPRWKCFFEGDKDESEDRDDIVLSPVHFPAGTRVTIEVPVCPECDEEAECCSCGFDWDAWIIDTYS